MMTAILALCGTVSMLTSCSDEDTSEPSSTPEVDERLYGSWTLDVDGMDYLDLSTLGMQFNNDQTMQFVLTNYVQRTDNYQSLTFNATYRPVGSKMIDDTEVQALEINFEDTSIEVEGENGVETIEPAVLKDTIYYQIEGDKFLFKTKTSSEEVGFGDLVCNKGLADTTAFDKATVRKFFEYYNQFYEEYSKDSVAAARDFNHAMARKNASSSEDRNLSKWMKEIPDDRMVCQLMIPGTHDAATFGLIHDWMMTLGKTQLLDWRGQFNAGVRAFDIRTRQRGNSTHLYHSMLDCNMQFANALDEFAKILKDNPDEGVILLVTGEDNDAKVDAKWQILLNGLSEMIPNSFNFDRVEMERTTKENLRLIEEKLGKPGLLAKYRPDMTMKDLRGKALVWLVNQPGSWAVDDAAYNNLRDYIALEKNGKVYATDGSSVPLVSQNDWECPGNMTRLQFVASKGGKFDAKFKYTAEHHDDVYWCSNAANAYYKEVNFIPNYVTFASLAYSCFISSILENPGCRGIVLQDYVGQDKMTRVHSAAFFSLGGAALLVSHGVTGLLVSAFNSLANFFFGKKTSGDVLAQAELLASYHAAALVTPSEYTHGQKLTEAVVESNFSEVEELPAILPITGTNTSTKEGYANLFDGNSSTKWCSISKDKEKTLTDVQGIWYVEFKTSTPVCAKSYTIFTGNDTKTYPKRNPKKWRLLGKVSKFDENWTTISTIDTGNGAPSLPSENYAQKQYDIDSPKEYQYYRLEIDSNWEDMKTNIFSTSTWMQLGGFKLNY